jgi:hypothetical protein
MSRNSMEQFHRYIASVCPPVRQWEWDPWNMGIRPAAAQSEPVR